MISIFGFTIGGLGLCYLGAWFLKHNIQALSGYLSNSVKSWIQLCTKNSGLAALLGIIFSIITGGEFAFVAYSNGWSSRKFAIDVYCSGFHAHMEHSRHQFTVLFSGDKYQVDFSFMCWV